jgi:transposase
MTSFTHCPGTSFTFLRFDLRRIEGWLAMAWGAMDVQQQRVRFVVAAFRNEKSLKALCAEFGISRPTGDLWRKRYQEDGLAGIAERSRRPHESPDRTAAELEQRVIAVRRRYPDWGARKLQMLLGREGLELTRSTIHRILLRHGLMRDQHRALDLRGLSGPDPQAWLDAYREEHNHVRPHQALDMRTPATRWQPSPHRYQPNPPPWQYPEGAWTLKVDSQGPLDIHRKQ